MLRLKSNFVLNFLILSVGGGKVISFKIGEFFVVETKMESKWSVSYLFI